MYNNKPLIFESSEGLASGLYIEILKHIAEEENWDLQFVKTSWDTALEHLKEGRIDLLPVIAYSTQRAELFDFNDETIIANWAEIYSSKNTTFSSILDLDGKRVAVQMGDIHLAALKELTDKFNVNCRFIETDGYTTIFEMLDAGYIDIGVVNRLYGRANNNGYDIKTTPLFSTLSRYDLLHQKVRRPIS